MTSPPLSPKPKLLGNHQRCWIWGRHLVETTLAVGRWPVLELLVSERRSSEDIAALRQMADARGIPLSVIAPDRIERCCRSADHQGVAARMTPFPYDRHDVAASIPTAGFPLWLVLDGIQDAHNFGAILRSADVFGVDGVWIAEREQVGVTSMVARASAGAVNHLPIRRDTDLITAIDSLRQLRFQIIGARETDGTAPDRIDWRRPTALILGNENRGIRPVLLQRCDRLASIPQRTGAVGSLNVAAAAAVLLYAAARQRSGVDQDGKIV